MPSGANLVGAAIDSSTMEHVSLTVGVGDLANLFNNAVDSFEYIQIGKELGTNFQTCQLRIGAARLELSRWGESVGLGPNTDAAKDLKNVTVLQKDIKKAEKLLSQIGDLFKNGEHISDSFKDETSAGDSALVLHDASTDLDGSALTLHRNMRNLSLKRHGRDGLRKKEKWGLYEQKHYSRLVEDIDGLVQKLVRLFPAAHSIQQKLCQREVEELGKDSGLPLLAKAALDHDAFLRSIIESALKQSGQQSHVANVTANQNQGFILGQMLGGSINGTQFGTEKK